MKLPNKSAKTVMSNYISCLVCNFDNSIFISKCKNSIQIIIPKACTYMPLEDKKDYPKDLAGIYVHNIM